MITPILKWLLPAAVLILLIGFFLSDPFAPTVTIAPVQQGTAINAVTGTVEVRANADLDVKARHRGRIVELDVKAGQAVSEGDRLVRQDSQNLDLQLEEVRIRLAAAEERLGLESTHAVDLESIREELESVRMAVDLGTTPASRLQNIERQRRKTEILRQQEQIRERETVHLLRNTRDKLQLELSQMSTRAPFDGTVAALKAFKGDLVHANQSLLRMVAHGRFLVMELTEEDFSGVATGQSVTLRLASYPDRTFTGTVTRLENTADANTKTRNVILEVDAPDEVLVPGLTGEGYLVKAERENTILIPRRALVGNVVYVVKDDNRIERRRVQPGFLSLNRAEIREGLHQGERVVLDDLHLLQDGQKVRLTEPDS